MIAWTPDVLAAAAGADLLDGPGERPSTGPTHAVIASAEAAADSLFVGLPGSNVDGGHYAADALARGAWGALARPEYLQLALEQGRVPDGAVLLAAADPLAALQQLARAWRRALEATVIAITGSTGKTTTKELAAAMGRTVARTHATPANLNTEIGLPLTILSAPEGTELLILEMGMRGHGQIAELCSIAEPQIGIVVNIGPAHLELMGSIEAIAKEKGSLLDHLPPGGTAIAPADEPLLAPHRHQGVHWITFGSGGDITPNALPASLGLANRPAHVQVDGAAALAAIRAAGHEPSGPLDALPDAGRGAQLPGVAGSLVIDDCYNANPMSMRAALHELSSRAAPRRVAVLGDMLELGDDERAHHETLGTQATSAGVGLLVTVGERAAHAARHFDGPTQHFATAHNAATALPALIEPGDAILVKGSRGIGLEIVVDALTTNQEDTWSAS